MRPPVLLVLAVMTALAPLSMDIYTPSLPRIQADLGGADWLAQASITACLLGIGVGQLLWGALSDRVGCSRSCRAGRSWPPSPVRESRRCGGGG